MAVSKRVSCGVKESYDKGMWGANRGSIKYRSM
jgi:hypothetical protein